MSELSVLSFNFILHEWSDFYVSTCLSFNETTSTEFAGLCGEPYVMKANLLSETSLKGLILFPVD